MREAIVFYQHLLNAEDGHKYERYYTTPPEDTDARTLGKILIVAESGYDVVVEEDDTGIYVSNGRPDDIPTAPHLVTSAPINIIMSGYYRIKGLHTQIIKAATERRRVPHIDHVYLG